VADAVARSADRVGRAGAVRAVLRALRRALPLLLDVRLLGRLVLWTALAFAIWIGIAVVAWEPATKALADAVGGGNAGVYAGVGIAVGVLFVAAAVVTALVAVATLAMPAIVQLVARKHFPSLERRQGGTWYGSLRNLVLTIVLFLPAWVFALVLFALPPVYLAVSWSLGAWLNQRLFRYDALAEHADRAELVRIPRQIRGRLFLMGLIFAPLALVPIVNLAVPLLAAIAFACLCLEALARDRVHVATL
jgi:hypothetical protein